MNEVTQILHRIEQGDPSSADLLLPLVYNELKRLAAAKMANESPDHTLQATALVHEAYVRLVNVKESPHWDSRAHFFAAAAEAMRRILVETARRKRRIKHGGEFQKVAKIEHAITPDNDMVALDEALTLLAEEDAEAAKMVELRYFAGLSHEEVAKTLDTTVYRARQKWTYARAWLRNALQSN